MKQSEIYPPPNNTVFSEETEYRRDLGLVEAVSIVIGRIIGSGIFRTPGAIMALTGYASLFWSVWLFGGIITVLHAVCYAELTAMMPRSGGPYVFIKTAYGPEWAFLRGWAMFFVSETGAIAAVALVFAEYSNQIWKVLTRVPFSHSAEIAIAVGIVWILTAINCFGVSLSGTFQNIFSGLKIAAIGCIAGVCFVSGGDSRHFMQSFFPETWSWENILAVGAGLRLSFFAFSGWEGATYIAEEVRHPRKNLPLSLLLGIAGVILLYLATNAAYLYQIGPMRMAESTSIAADAMRAAVGGAGGVLISAAVMLSTFGNVSTQILCKARTWQAMSRDGLFFDFLAPLNEKYKTPNRAFMAQAAWTTVILGMLWVVYRITKVHAGSSYETVIAFFSATGSIFNIMAITSVFIFRKRYPHVSRPYRAWGYPWSVVTVIALLSVYLVITLITAPIPSCIGIAVTLTGMVYYLAKRKRHDEKRSVR